MSGIAGIQGECSAELDATLDKIKHRGPHAAWTRQIGNINLGCCELDVGGKSRAGSHYAVKNNQAAILDGHIYNPQEPELSDAEALLDFYQKFGAQFAGRVKGGFACAVADGEALILARDAIGLKPLYYGHRNGQLCFASEAKGLLDIEDVKEFPPGYIYSRDLGFQKYASEDAKTPEFENFEQGKKVLVQLLREATLRRMKDNAVGGIFLSGGLDSSIIAYIAKEIKPDIEAFTVSMENGQDLPLARDVTKYLGINHHVLMFGEKEINAILPRAIYHIEMFEESCVHGAIANFMVGQFANSYTHCVLTGEGADEFLGGYDGQFRQAKNHEEVASVVDRLINVAHNTALQRLDRLMAANSMEARIPFADAKVVDFCHKIPIKFKIHGSEQIGKWILRQAFEGCLPDHIIHQTKRFFAQGSGVAWVMRSQAEKCISEAELAEHNQAEHNPRLSSIEELYYYRMFKKTFSHPAFDRLVGRWDPFKPDFFLR